MNIASCMHNYPLVAEWHRAPRGGGSRTLIAAAPPPYPCRSPSDSWSPCTCGAPGPSLVAHCGGRHDGVKDRHLMHTYTHTHIHTCIHTYTRTHKHTHTHTHIHTYTHTYAHTLSQHGPSPVMLLSSLLQRLVEVILHALQCLLMLQLTGTAPLVE